MFQMISTKSYFTSSWMKSFNERERIWLNFHFFFQISKLAGFTDYSNTHPNLTLKRTFTKT
jgi:hypothetical protein